MRRFLTTLQRDGSFDFFSNIIIEIEKYDYRDKDDLISILQQSPESLDQKWQAEALSLYFHEYTHFLDVTSTTWGLEFLFRKNNVINSFGSHVDLEKYWPVFMLNLSEIDVHSKLIEIHKDAKLLQCETKHAAIYSKDYGSIIVIYFTSDGLPMSSHNQYSS